MAELRVGRRNFLRWGFGYEERWPVRCEPEVRLTSAGPLAGHNLAPYCRWVEVEDGPRLRARMGRASVLLHFSRGVHERMARGWMREARQPFLQKLELSDVAADEPTGELTFIRTALPVSLDGPLCVVVPSDLALPEIPRSEVLEAWGNRSMINTGARLLALVSTPILFDVVDVQDAPVTLFLTDGGRLECVIRASGSGDFLELRHYQQQGRPQAPDARLVALPVPIAFVDAPSAARGTDLTPLRGRPHPHLTFWVEYERGAQQAAAEAIQRRTEDPFEYDTVEGYDGERRGFQVSLVDAGAKLRHWIAPDAHWKTGEEILLGEAVEVRPVGTEGKGVLATLTALLPGADGRLHAQLVATDPTALMPPRGKIFAVGSRGDERQRQRRRDAVERLRRGQTCNPDLLAHLYAPGSVPEVKGPNTVLRPRRGSTPELTGDQRDAVLGAAKCPALFLIQGPPGTGKTLVITEIIEHLRHRHRRRVERGDAPPLRILVSSVQNVAVQNVVERLKSSDTDLFVYDDIARSDGRRGGDDRQQADRVRAAVVARLSTSPRFLRYQHLRQMLEHLHSLHEELVRSNPGADVRTLLAAFQGESWPNLLTASLHEELGELVARPVATEQQPIVATAIQDADTTASTKTVLAEAYALSDDLDDGAASRLETLLGTISECLLRAGTERQLGIEAARARAMLRSRSRLEQPSDELRQFWKALRARIGVALAEQPVSDSTCAVAAPASSADESFLNDALAWAARAVGNVQAEIDMLRQSEDAILADWAEALAREPRLVAEIERVAAPVVAATCNRAAPRSRQTTSDDMFFDVAIVDEAARAGIDIVIPLTLARSTILVGDHLQLPPYVEDDLIRRIEQHLVDAVADTPSLFGFLRDGLPTRNFVALRHQYRMHENIGRIISAVFYEPKGIRLTHHFSGERAVERLPDFGLFGNEPLVWVDTKDRARTPERNATERWPYRYRNPVEGRIVREVLKRCDRAALARYTASGVKPIGLLTFYRAQQDLLQTALEALAADLLDHVDCGTVDSFQGREFPLVLLSCVRSNPQGDVGFLSLLPQRINVALSRAQRQLVIVGDSATLCPSRHGRGSPWLQQVFEMLRTAEVPGRIVNSAELIDA